MNLRRLIEKAIIKGEKLNEEERIHLLDYFERAEQTAAPSNPVTGQVSIPSQHEIDLMVQEAITAHMSRNFPRLSDISHVAGTLVAGEFRSGNFKAPGDGFTGGRFGYPGFDYDGVTYFLAGVEDDVLQVGLALASGKLVAGGGDVTLDADGLTIANQEGDVTFEDSSGATDTISIFSDGDDALVLKNAVGDKPILFEIDDAAHSIRQHSITYEGMNLDGGQYFISGVPLGASGTFTPNIDASTNTDAVSIPGAWVYIRVLNQVLVSGPMTIDPTAAGAVTVNFSTAPGLASDFTTAFQASGNGTQATSNTVGSVSSDATNDNIILSFTATDTASRVWRVTATYQIL